MRRSRLSQPPVPIRLSVRDPAAQPLERAAPEGGMRVERVVERADEQDAGLLEMIRHQPVGSVASVHHLRHHILRRIVPDERTSLTVVTRVGDAPASARLSSSRNCRSYSRR